MGGNVKRLSSSQIIILGFAAAIIIGALLLMMPFSAREPVSFSDALFTATSAVCVTGLVVRDTATGWTAFGQGVILLLIQVGGMGVVTIAVALAMVSGKKISLKQRSTMQEAISAHKVGGLFHSVSAFCNAGFVLMGVKSPYSSLTFFADDPIINIVVMVLIVVGGIGFLTWDDVRTHKFHLHRYRMQSKVVIVTTALLIALPAICFFFLEFDRLPLPERILTSLFQAITPRTAGFNTADLTAMSDTGSALMILLMLIGGSPGSTAGGMKTTTFALLLSTAISVFRSQEHTHFFGRRIAHRTVRSAATILMMYLVLFLTGGLLICRVEGLPLMQCLFETASAIGTVGLTMGITPTLGQFSRAVLIRLMFVGRVGGLTLIFSALSGHRGNTARLPEEKLTVG